MTPKTRRALKILADKPGISAAGFADRMWPNSPAHRRVYRCGNRNGAARGTAIVRAAGAYLGRLSGRGLVRITYESYVDSVGRERTGSPSYRLTDLGRASLK